MSDTPNLLPCPFCKGNDITRKGFPLSGWIAQCEDCGASCEGNKWDSRPTINRDAAIGVVWRSVNRSVDLNDIDNRRADIAEVTVDALIEAGFLSQPKDDTP
jgi:ribosomal protein L37AE/L43A